MVGGLRTQWRARRGGHAQTLPPSDEGGIWVMTGVVLVLIAYAGVIVLLIAGYTSVLPLVIVPLVMAGLIGANNLLGGGRTYGRTPGRPVGDGQAPLSSSGPNGPLPGAMEDPVATGPDSPVSLDSPTGLDSPLSPDSPVSPASSGVPASQEAPGEGT
jgi:hypothetical protein